MPTLAEAELLPLPLLATTSATKASETIGQTAAREEAWAGRDALAREATAQAEEAARDEKRRRDEERQEVRARVMQEGGGCGGSGRRNCAPGRSGGRSARG